MKTAKLSLTILACAAAIPAIAQNTTDSRCGMTNFDRNRNMFTIVHPTPGIPNQQCFLTVVSKQSWPGGMPDLSSSELVEGNYEITLSGGGGGGGGGTERVGGGGGGAGAVPITSVRYLQPGVYRMTIGSGGHGGAPNGGLGGAGAPTSLSVANTGETVAGYAGADSWNGTYASNTDAVPEQRESSRYARKPRAGGTGGQPVAAGQSSGGRGGSVGREPKGQDGSALVGKKLASSILS